VRQADRRKYKSRRGGGKFRGTVWRGRRGSSLRGPHLLLRSEGNEQEGQIRHSMVSLAVRVGEMKCRCRRNDQTCAIHRGCMPISHSIQFVSIRGKLTSANPNIVWDEVAST